jgi:hypothetical protein
VVVIELRFTEVARTQQSRHDGGAAVVVGASDQTRDTITRLVPEARAGGDQVLEAAFQGQQRTGGYAITITKLELIGDRLLVHAVFTAPPQDAIVTQVLTSPAHVVSVARGDIAGAKTAVLLDESGAERARTNIA